MNLYFLVPFRPVIKSDEQYEHVSKNEAVDRQCANGARPRFKSVVALKVNADLVTIDVLSEYELPETLH